MQAQACTSEKILGVHRGEQMALARGKECS